MLPSFSPLEMARLLRLPFILTPHRSRSSHRYGTARGPDRKSERALAHMPGVTERRMFGGTTFMVNGKMCISAGHHRLMCRIDPELHATAIARRGVRTVRMTGRAYRGFVYVREEAVASRRDLHYWVRLCLAFNKRAKSRARGQGLHPPRHRRDRTPCDPGHPTTPRCGCA